MFFIHPVSKLLGICPRQKSKNSGRSATSNSCLTRGGNCLESTSSRVRPCNGSGGYSLILTHQVFGVSRFQKDLGVFRFQKDTHQVFGVLSLPCSILCYIGVAIFSPAIALAQFLGSLLACFAALGVQRQNCGPQNVTNSPQVGASSYSEVYMGVWSYSALLTAGATVFFTQPSLRSPSIESPFQKPSSSQISPGASFCRSCHRRSSLGPLPRPGHLPPARLHLALRPHLLGLPALPHGERHSQPHIGDPHSRAEDISGKKVVEAADHDQQRGRGNNHQGEPTECGRTRAGVIKLQDPKKGIN